MKFQKIIILILLMINFSSCEKFLDTKPSDFIDPEAYYSNPNELQTALNGVYASLISVDSYGNNYLYMFNTNTDESYGRAVELVPSYQYSVSESKIDLFWRAMYLGINRANLLLANLEDVKMDQTKKNIIHGEALFLRAYYHFMLVSNFGDVPLIITPTESILNVNIARTPMKEVYQQVIDDMTLAESLLTTQTATSLGYGGKITKTGVQGMLARVCLYMAGFPVNDFSKYNEALSWAKKVVNPTTNAPEHRLNPDYSQVFINYAKDQYDVKESMWEIEFAGIRDGKNMGCTYTGRFAGVYCIDVNKGFSVGFVNATRKLYDSYQLNPASTTTPNKASYDLRRDWNCANYTWGLSSTAVFTPVTNTWIMNAGKWRREYEVLTPKDVNYTPENFVVLRYSDVLLMLAEAEFRVNGATPLAMDAINQVRRRAYGLLLPTPPNPTVNADMPTNLNDLEFMEYIKSERSRELCFEALRRNDLIRWGDFVGDMKEFLAYALANGGTSLPITTPATQISPRNIYLPIPLRELSLNKALIQNPGY